MSCAQRTLPGTIDAIAHNDPNRTWARFPESQEAFEQGRLISVSFAALANAINRLAWYLDALLPERNDFDTIAYVGPSDIRYYILACAACKCRLKVRFLTARFHIALTDCKYRHCSHLPETTSLHTCRYLRVLAVEPFCGHAKFHPMHYSII